MKVRKVYVQAFCLLFFFMAVLQLMAQNDAVKKTVVEVESRESIFNLLLKGGPIMIPLAICSIVALTVAFERLITLRLTNIVPKKFLNSMKEADTDVNRMREVCLKSKSPLARILDAGISKWMMFKKDDLTEKEIEDVAVREIGRMKRSLRPLKHVAAVAPLLGLLGTVFGMIRSFQDVALSSASFGKADKLAHGIYEAMVTTAAGLSIAIPTLLIFYFLNNRIDSFADDIEIECNRFIDDFIHSPNSKKGMS